MSIIDNFDEINFPEDWKIDILGNFGEFQYGYTTSAIDEDTGIKFLRITDIKDLGIINWDEVPYAKISNKKIEKCKLYINDIVFARIGATTGKTTIINQNKLNAIFASYLIRFYKIKNEIYPLYLFYYTQSRLYWDIIDSLKGGKLKKGINSTELSSIKFPIPEYNEQKNISIILESLRNNIINTDTIIKDLLELKKSLLQHLFTYGPIPLDKRDSVELKETEIGLLPKEWEITTLDKLATMHTGGTPSRKKDEYWNGDIPWAKSGELNDSRVYTVEENISQLGLENSNAKYVEPDTLLVALYGATAGKVGIAKARFTINQAICAIRNNDFINPEFYFYYFIYIRESLLSKRFGGAQPNLNQQIIKDTLVPKIPLEIQNKIAKILTTCNIKIECEKGKKIALETLFRTLLEKLMTGQIRVNELNLKKIQT